MGWPIAIDCCGREFTTGDRGVILVAGGRISADDGLVVIRNPEFARDLAAALRIDSREGEAMLAIVAVRADGVWYDSVTAYSASRPAAEVPTVVASIAREIELRTGVSGARPIGANSETLDPAAKCSG